MDFKKEFPLLNEIVYLDNAAGTLKPLSVVKAMEDFYVNYPVNPHSGDSPLGIKVHAKIAEARKKTASLINCKEQEVIFTSGTTDSLNRVALMLEKFINKDDQIILTNKNHNSNIIPFIEIAQRKGATLTFIEEKDIELCITNKTKVVALPQKANSLMAKIDLDAIYAKAKEYGAIVINDAAQAIVTEKVSFDNCDVIAFSGNKLYGPTGIGVLAIKEEILNKLYPATFGGGATTFLKLDGTYGIKEGVDAYEAGTPNTAGIIGLSEAIDFFNNTKHLIKNVKELAEYAHDKLSANKDIIIHSQRGDESIMFDVKDISAQDVVSTLARKNIYLRSGLFCAFLNKANQNGSIRCSLAIYNTKEDIDKLCDAISEGGFLDFL